MKSARQITQDIYDVLLYSPLKQEAKGEMYKDTRPQGSVEEDIIIRCDTNLPLQRQQAVVYVLVYVQGIIQDGLLVKDDDRMDRLEQACFDTFEMIRQEDYHLVLEEQGEESVEATGEFAITNRLTYEIINE